MRSFTQARVFGLIIVTAQCMHCHLRDVTAAIDEQWWEDKRAQNSTTRVSFCTIIMSDGNYSGVVRIFIGFSLHYILCHFMTILPDDRWLMGMSIVH